MSFGILDSVLKKFLFVPPKPDPTDIKLLKDCSLVPIQTEDYVIPCLFTRCKKTPTHILIYCHGNAASICQPELQKVMVKTAKTLGVCILAVEYPDYGYWNMVNKDSKIKVTLDEKNINYIVGLVLHFVLTKWEWPSKKIFLWGTSLGTGSATKTTATVCSHERPLGGLILQCPYSSIRDMAAKMINTSNTTISFIISDIWNTKQEIKNVTCPVLVIHGERDQIIPCKHSQIIFNNINNINNINNNNNDNNNNITKCPKTKLILLKSATHNAFNYNRDVWPAMSQFISE